MIIIKNKGKESSCAPRRSRVVSNCATQGGENQGRAVPGKGGQGASVTLQPPINVEQAGQVGGMTLFPLISVNLECSDMTTKCVRLVFSHF